MLTTQNTITEHRPELVVMLTHHDYTVENAEEIFLQCKDSQAKYWGFKENPLPKDQMYKLAKEMRENGKTTILEVVAYSEEEGLAGAKTAAECGCDILMGTCFSDRINDYCHVHQIKYMPFVGMITGRPSILSGNMDDIIREAQRYVDKGVYGIDLLGYRYTGDAITLNRSFIRQVKCPVCLAGSIDSFQRLDEVKISSPWTFTIGSAFFENKFGCTMREQIDKVFEYMNTPIV